MIRPYLYAATWRHANGWTASEVFRGPRNMRLGLLITDETGKSQGFVQNARDLP